MRFIRSWLSLVAVWFTAASLWAGVNLNLYDTRQTVDMMGVDMERSGDFLLKASNPGEIVQWFFKDTAADVCRVKYDKNQELVEGVFNHGYYSNQIVAMKLIQATNPAIKFFAVLRSDYMGFNTDDTNNWPTWIYSPSFPDAQQPQNFNAVKYGGFLAAFVTHMATNGVPVAYLNTGKETTGIVNASNSVIAIDVMNSILTSNGIARPKIVGPGAWGLPAGTTFVDDTINNGWEDRYEEFSNHNLGRLGADDWQGFSDLAHGVNKSSWDEESSAMAGGRSNGVETNITTMFEGMTLKFEAYRGGVNGEIFFEVWSRGINSETRSVYFRNGQPGQRLRSYYFVKEFINTVRGKRRVVEDVTSAPGLSLIAFRSSTNAVIWAMNTNASPINNLVFTIAGGAITGQVSRLHWDDTTGATGSTMQFNAGAPGQFTNTIPAESVLRFSFNIALTPLASAAWYALDGNAQDGSGNGNHASLSNSPAFVLGRVGPQALRFNGSNSFARVPRSIGAATTFSIAFWLRTTSVGGSGSQWWNGAGLVDGEVAGSTNDFGVSLLNGRIACGVGRPDTTLQSTVTVNDGQWHHVAVTRNGYDGELTLHIDGVLDATLYAPTGPRTAPPFLRLGSLQTGAAGKFFNGTLDDVRLYNGLLDSADIAQLAAVAPHPAPVISGASIGNGSFQFTFNGDAGLTYTVLVSTNLIEWTVAMTTNPPTLPVTLLLPASNTQQRFYRLQSGP